MNRVLIVGVIGALIVGSFSGAWAAATITGADIVDKSIGNVDLAADSVDGSKIKNLSIKTSDLGDGIITSGKLKDGTIQREDMGAGVLPVGANEILHGSCQPADTIVPAHSTVEFTCPGRITGLHRDDHMVGSLKYSNDQGQLMLGSINTNFDCFPSEDCLVSFMLFNPTDADESPGTFAKFDFVAWR
jgi:hypothetical protein